MEDAAGHRRVPNTCPILGDSRAKVVTKADLATPAPTRLSSSRIRSLSSPFACF